MCITLTKTVPILIFTIAALVLNGCKPDPHPSNPNYAIQKPPVRFEASRKNLDKMVKNLQGKPYVWAEEGPDYFDCSGYTYYMYGSMGIEIPRVSRDQAKKGKEIKIDALKYGDLIFFDTEPKRKGKITHVGMYLGKGWFTHASTTKHEIVYSNLNTSPYYKKRLRICRRYLPETTSKIVKSERHKPWKTTAKTKVPTLPKVIKKHELGNFYIQVGSFTGRPKEALLHKIVQAGYHYKIIEFPINGTTLSKLLIGPYRQRSDAGILLEKIKTSIKKDAFIAEVR
ncbi:MAG: NlpC/P60 family protein [Campylobacterota bacterium]|nr:NlpC/P60 family protein [Campylobacterota bacterium]